jgi:hypothetical protein
LKRHPLPVIDFPVTICRPTRVGCLSPDACPLHVLHFRSVDFFPNANKHPCVSFSVSVRFVSPFIGFIGQMHPQRSGITGHVSHPRKTRIRARISFIDPLGKRHLSGRRLCYRGPEVAPPPPPHPVHPDERIICETLLLPTVKVP